MEPNFEVSSIADSGSDCVSIPYSHMTEEDAEIAYLTRKTQIKAMLKARSELQTPDSNYCKRTENSTKSTKSVKPSQVPLRFVADSEKVSQHTIDFPFQSQQQLKQRLNNFKPPISENKKYDVQEPLYQRTVQWKNNLNKLNKDIKLTKDEQILNECTFEPNLEKSEIRNLSLGIYERHCEWKNSIKKRNDMILNINRLKELEDCSFHPKIIKSENGENLDFLERNNIWKDHIRKKSKIIREASDKKYNFKPKINHNLKVPSKDNNFDNRYSEFISRITEITAKIDSSLADSVL
jgi:hypothetical protein